MNLTSKLEMYRTQASGFGEKTRDTNPQLGATSEPPSANSCRPWGPGLALTGRPCLLPLCFFLSKKQDPLQLHRGTAQSRMCPQLGQGEARRSKALSTQPPGGLITQTQSQAPTSNTKDFSCKCLKAMILLNATMHTQEKQEN